MEHAGSRDGAEARRALRAMRRHGPGTQEIGTPALVAAGLLSLTTLFGIVATGFLLERELTTGGDLGDPRTQVVVLSLVLGVLVLAGTLIGTWLRTVRIVAGVFVLLLLGFVFTLTSTGTPPLGQALGTGLAGGLLWQAWTRWEPYEEV